MCKHRQADILGCWHHCVGVYGGVPVHIRSRSCYDSVALRAVCIDIVHVWLLNACFCVSRLVFWDGFVRVVCSCENFMYVGVEMHAYIDVLCE